MLIKSSEFLGLTLLCILSFSLVSLTGLICVVFVTYHLPSFHEWERYSSNEDADEEMMICLVFSVFLIMSWKEDHWKSSCLARTSFFSDFCFLNQMMILNCFSSCLTFKKVILHPVPCHDMGQNTKVSEVVFMSDGWSTSLTQPKLYINHKRD